MTYTEEASPLYGYTGADETVSGRSCRPRQSKFLDVRILDMHKNRNEKLKAKALAEEQKAKEEAEARRMCEEMADNDFALPTPELQDVMWKFDNEKQLHFDAMKDYSQQSGSPEKLFETRNAGVYRPNTRGENTAPGSNLTRYRGAATS